MEGMITGGEGGDSELEHLVGGVPVDPRPSSHVLAIGDDHVRRVVLPHAREKKPDRFAARLPHDVADEENAQDYFA